MQTIHDQQPAILSTHTSFREALGKVLDTLPDRGEFAFEISRTKAKGDGARCAASPGCPEGDEVIMHGVEVLRSMCAKSSPTGAPSSTSSTTGS